MTKASIIGDYQEIYDATSPRLIRIMGGKEKALSLMKESFLSLEKDHNLKIDTVINNNKLKIEQLGDIKYKIIPQFIIMSLKGREEKLVSMTNLLAIKENEKSDWKFMDINNFDKGKITYLLPEFKNKNTLNIKVEEKPILVPNKDLQLILLQLEKTLDSYYNL
ncbi:hypothetical protein [Sphingobacterium lactis]|uniref:hypothetical protein n=1 Tax=Sphingobacterium lactis TaxID=797291 RepID=UPI003F823D1B